MRLSALWSIVHAWNDNRKHRQCMVTSPRDIDILPPDHVYLCSEYLVIDWVNAATHGTLKPHKEQPQ